MKKSDLGKKLEQYDLQGIKFYEAKKLLMKEGYLENEIDIAAASRPFDGQKNVPRSQDPVTKVFHDNPELAKEHADLLMEQDAAQQDTSRRASLLKSSFTYPFSFGRINPISSRGMMVAADFLGIPLFSLIGVGIFITAGLYGLSTFDLLPIEVVWAAAKLYLVFVAGVFIIASVRAEWRSWHRKSKTTNHMILSGILALLFSAYTIWAILSFF